MPVALQQMISELGSWDHTLGLPSSKSNLALEASGTFSS